MAAFGSQEYTASGELRRPATTEAAAAYGVF
jgi:hypothetical protein